MMNAEELARNIWSLMDCLHGLIFLPDRLASCMVRLLFLKYVVDNNTWATDIESMQFCAKAQKMFAMRDTETGLDTIIPVLSSIDHAYKLDHILSSSDTIEHYAGELFGMDKSRQKRNVNDQSFKRIMDKLGSLDLEEASDNHELGKMIVDYLLSLISKSSVKSAYGAEFTTNDNLAILVKGILDVKQHDVFCDFASGLGTSTIKITGDILPETVIVDINPEAVATSSMMLIMYGFSKFKAFCEDSLSKEACYVTGNKIFVDPPIGLKLNKTEDSQYTDSALAAIDRIIHGYLLQDGVAVMTVPSGPLFRVGPAAGVKKEIVTLGLLQAVIALPPMWNGTRIGTNLIILSKKPTFKTLFIEASDSATRASDKKNNAVLSTESIQKIIDVIKKPRDIQGLSKMVAGSDIVRNEYNLVPANYVIQPEEEESISLKEIDDQLTELYRQLGM